MDKIVEIGFPMEYEDDNHIIRTGMWLKENEVKALEKRLNKYNHLQSKIDKANKLLDKLTSKYILNEDYKKLQEILKEVE